MDIRQYMRTYKDIPRNVIAEMSGLSPASLRSWLAHGGSTLGKEKQRAIYAAIIDYEKQYFKQIEERKQHCETLTFP